MSDEVVIPATGQPAQPAAPNAGETASPAEAPVSGENTPEAKEPKTFTQEEVDALIAKRLARAERKRDREQPVQHQPQTPATPAPVVDAKPKIEDFKTTEEFLEALAEHKAEQKVNEKLDQHDKSQREARARAAHESVIREHVKREDVARDKYDDFDEVVYDDSLPVTRDMALAIQLSDNGAELEYYLGRNRKEAERISRLHPLAQAKELGKLEAKLADAPAPAKTSSAPDPIRPIGGKGSAAKVLDTTDPRAAAQMSTSEWIAAERKRQIAKAAAR